MNVQWRVEKSEYQWLSDTDWRESSPEWRAGVSWRIGRDASRQDVQQKLQIQGLMWVRAQAALPAAVSHRKPRVMEVRVKNCSKPMITRSCVFKFVQQVQGSTRKMGWGWLWFGRGCIKSCVASQFVNILSLGLSSWGVPRVAGSSLGLSSWVVPRVAGSSLGLSSWGVPRVAG